MSLLKKLGQGTGYLKAGFLGFPKSGKTFTAKELAIGTREFLQHDGPIAMFDTEGGSEYIAADIRERTGHDLLGIRSRKFDDLVGAAHECVDAGVSVLIVDSVTHVWTELCESYLVQINEIRERQRRSKQRRLEFQDWNVLKPKWRTWTDTFLNVPLHIIICGRAGFEWDFQENEDGKRELIKTGVKMKTESEFGFEPSLLVEMQREQERDSSAGKLTGTIIHRATVLGDRFNVMDGQQADNPGFDFFRPHIERLVPGAHATIDTQSQSNFDLDEDGYSPEQKEGRLRAIFSEKIKAELLKVEDGAQTAKAKMARQTIIEETLSTTSWTEVESMPSSDLKRAFPEVQAKVAAYNAGGEEAA